MFCWCANTITLGIAPSPPCVCPLTLAWTQTQCKPSQVSEGAKLILCLLGALRRTPGGGGAADTSGVADRPAYSDLQAVKLRAVIAQYRSYWVIKTAVNGKLYRKQGKDSPSFILLARFLSYYHLQKNHCHSMKNSSQCSIANGVLRITRKGIEMKTENITIV